MATTRSASPTTSLADTFFAVVHGRAPSTFPQEDVGAEVSGTGIPSGEFDVTVTGNKVGNFYPRIAASTVRNEWMMTTATAFVVASAQRIKTLANGGGPPPAPPPPPPPIELTGPNVPNGSWFMAEGAESGTPTGFHTFYLVANEHDDPIDARAWFVADDGVLKYQRFTVAARSRVTVTLQARPASARSAASSSRRRRGATSSSRARSTGARTSRAAPASRRPRTWRRTGIFAEGSRGGELFDNFFLIFNPLPTATTVGRHLPDRRRVK